MPTLIETSTLEECGKLCAELGLHFIELNMNLPQYQLDRIDVEYFKSIADKYGIYYTIHLDQNLNISDFNPYVSEAYTKTVANTIEIAKQLGANIAAPINACTERIKLLAEGDLHTEVVVDETLKEAAILTTAAKADLVDETLLNRIYAQMTYLNKTAAHIMRKYEVHSCTDVTGFSLLGHSFEMAQGSDCTIHIDVANVPFHKEAYEFAEIGFIPAGAYRNRDFAENGVHVVGDISRAMQDIMYDPQTIGGLLIAVAEKDATQLHHELVESGVQASIVGHVTEAQDYPIILG